MLERIFQKFVKYKRILLPILLIFVAAFPLIFSTRYLIRLGTMCLLNVAITLSLNLMTGYMGQMSFGHAAFYGIGAYTGALIVTRLGLGSGVGFLAAMLVSGMFGLLVALPVARLSGMFLTLVTLGFCEIVRMVELNWTSLTRGPLGIIGIAKPSFFGLEINSATGIYYLMLVLLLFTLFVIRSIIESRLGRAIKALRDDQLAATAMGVPVFRYKVMVFVISSMLAGLCGAFYAQYSNYIDPSLFTTSVSTEMLTMVIFGGLGSIAGSVIGAVVLTALPELLRGFMEYRMVFYGLLIIVLMLIQPKGLFGNINFKYIQQRMNADSDRPRKPEEVGDQNG